MKNLLKKIEHFLNLSKKNIPVKKFDIVEELPKNLKMIIGEVWEGDWNNAFNP